MDSDTYDSVLSNILESDNILLKYQYLKQLANSQYQMTTIDITDDRMDAIRLTLNDIVKPDLQRILTELHSR